jgi:hypothetical protein
MISFEFEWVPEEAFDREFNAINTQAVTGKNPGLISGPTSHSLRGP